VNQFKYGGEDSSDSIVAKVFKGTFRFFSGLIAKRSPRAMSAQTSMATIGIRGTQMVGKSTKTMPPLFLWNPKIQAAEPQLRWPINLVA